MIKIRWKDIEWWGESDFSPVFYVNEEAIDRTDKDGHPIVLCDICNERITKFPVPIINGYALCPKHFKELVKVV
jgi:formylmethanofuran dehydrogenase subunit E